MVTIVTGQTQTPPPPPRPRRVPPQVRKNIQEEERLEEQQPQQNQRFFRRPSPGIVFTPEGGVRVTLRPGESSDLRWSEDKTQFGGTITSPRKTTGIMPIPEVSHPISQSVADRLGISRQYQQELYAPVDTYGDTRYREKLLSSGIAEPGVSPMQITEFIVQAPSYVGTGAVFKGVAGAIRASSKIGFKAFQIGTAIMGAGTIGYSAVDIAATKSKTQQQFKTFNLAASLGLIMYGAKPTYYGYRYPSTHIRTPRFIQKIQNRFDHRDYGGFSRQPNVKAAITEKTTTRPLPDTKTGKIIDVGGKQTQTGLMTSKPPPVEQTITGYKGYQNLKEIMKSPFIDIGKGGTEIPPITESGYARAMKYLVSDYGKPSKFSGFRRLEGGNIIGSTEATGMLLPQRTYKPLISTVSRTSPSKMLYWRGEFIRQMQQPSVAFVPVVKRYDIQQGYSLLQQEQNRMYDVLLELNTQQRRNYSMIQQEGRTLLQEEPLVRQRRQDFAVVQQQVAESITSNKKMFPKQRVTSVRYPYPFLLDIDFGKPSGGYRIKKRYGKKGSLKELPIPTLQNLLGGGINSAF